MSAVIARALAMIAVVFQSYFNWDSNSTTTILKSRALPAPQGGEGAAYHLAGLVLARGGSKGIPRKNLAEVGGRPLIGRALDEMINSGVFTSIWVSTDDPDIAKWVRNRYSKEIVAIHNRAAYTATDTATSITAVLEFVGLHPEVDCVGLVQATSPFLQSNYLKEAFEKLGKYESVFSVTRSHHLRWSPETNHKTSPINFNPRKRPRRQDWQGEMVENGMFYFAHRHVLVNYGVFQAENSAYVEIPKHLSMEIDTPEDLRIAQCLASVYDQDKTNVRNRKDPKIAQNEL